MFVSASFDIDLLYDESTMRWAGFGVASLAVGAAGSRSLPAPASDFYLEGPPGHEHNFTYLNTATLGPSPKSVVEALAKEAASIEKNPNIDAYDYWRLGAEVVRRKAAAFLGCDADEVLLTPSTTVGLNTVGEGLVGSGFVTRGDRVLVTDQEHYGSLNTWKYHGNTTGVEIDVVPVGLVNMSAAAVLAAFRKQLDAKPYKVVAISHVLTTTGFKMPLSEIADLVHAKGGLLVVDGAQAPGGLNVDFHATKADAYATSTHKWGLGPKGSGLLCVAKAAQPKVYASYLTGGYGLDIGNGAPGNYGVKTTSSGTLPPHTIAGQGAAFDYLSGFSGGLDAVEKHNMGLRAYAAAKFAAAGLHVLGAADPVDSAPILTLALPDSHSATWTFRRLYVEHGVFVKSCGAEANPDEWPPGAPKQALRFSFHVYNSEAQVDHLVASILSILGKDGSVTSDMIARYEAFLAR